MEIICDIHQQYYTGIQVQSGRHQDTGTVVRAALLLCEPRVYLQSAGGWCGDYGANFHHNHA